MTYELEFHEDALKEFNKLDNALKKQIKKKLEQRVLIPHVVADSLRGMKNCYKIKLRSAGYRLVYEVIDEKLVVVVLTVLRRDSASYQDLAKHFTLRKSPVVGAGP